jgi:hypothetical protein
MPSTWSPQRTEVAPQQGDLFSGIPGRLQPDPHFQETGEVAYGVAVSLEERNQALQSAFTRLGRMASSAAFREVGTQQAEGRRNRAVMNLEGRYSQSELTEKVVASERAIDGNEKALDATLRQAFGYGKLVDSELFPEVTAEKTESAFLTGGPVAPSSSPGQTPGHREGKREFEARFKGSNHSKARHAYRSKLKRQATQLGQVVRISPENNRNN